MDSARGLACLDLDSPRWADLSHAYGPASDIPGLLVQLDGLPSSANNAEPWNALWSALAHQGDVYSASFAAVPHVVRSLALAPLTADQSFFQLPAVIEMCRQQKSVNIPDDLRGAYFAALAALPALIGQAAAREWDGEFLAVAMSALAAAKGHAKVAEAALELTPDVADEFLDWFWSR